MPGSHYCQFCAGHYLSAIHSVYHRLGRITMTKFVAAEIIVASLLLLIPGIATAQSSSCTWIATPTPHGLCKVNNGTYGDGDACDNGQTCGEGCCSWEFRIKNVWEGCEITRVDICADRD